MSVAQGKVALRAGFMGHGAVPLLDDIKTTCVEWLFQVFPKRACPGLYTHPHALITYPVLNTNNDYRS
jgi:hypothetical protein